MFDSIEAAQSRVPFWSSLLAHGGACALLLIFGAGPVVHPVGHSHVKLTVSLLPLKTRESKAARVMARSPFNPRPPAFVPRHAAVHTVSALPQLTGDLPVAPSIGAAPLPQEPELYLPTPPPPPLKTDNLAAVTIPVIESRRAKTPFRPAGFGEATIAAVLPRRQVPAKEDAQVPLTPVEILFKPKPVYTGEARQLHIEGEVLLEVLFTAAGETRVIQVVRGLGHGLDESAAAAARQIRFRPAERNGQASDFLGLVHIQFQLAY